MLNEYYRKLVTKYFGTGKNFLIFFYICGSIWNILFVENLSPAFLFAVFVGEQHSRSGSVDYAISHAVKDSTKLSMTRKFHDGNVETSITAEKGSSFD